MNRLYIFFPHCYIKATSSELLIYDTKTFKSAYMRNIMLSGFCIDRLNRFGCIEESDATKHLLQKVEANHFGYYVQHEELMPFIPERKLRITTSLHKEKKALGYNLTSYTNMMLRSLTILLNNTVSSYLNTLSYIQLEYPDINSKGADLEKLLVQVNSFCLERLVLAGEISSEKLEKLIRLANDRNFQVIYRIHYLAYSSQYIQELLHKFDSLIIELLVDNNTPFEILNVKEERLVYKYIITKVSDIERIQNIENEVILYPIFLDLDSITLQSQMILTKKEILHSRQTLKECYIKEYVNQICFGHLTINYNGDIYCLAQKIGSLQNMDLSYIINKWISSQDCLWYYTRKEKACCKECALQALCPPISIHEQLNAYKSPCMV